MKRAILPPARPRFQCGLPATRPATAPCRLKIIIQGAVQGVGFRPFLFRLAAELKLAGWVKNSVQGVLLEVEGSRPALEQMLLRIPADKPPRSSIQSLETAWLDPVGHTRFEILESQPDGPKSAILLPDIATCADCRREILDPQNRRYRHPFTNCTHCGPRFSIIEQLPYDRANISMKKFPLCPACQREYADPQSRRFHAQPNACPACGPHLELWSAEGEAIFGGDKALRAAAQMIRRGKIVAVKDVGGFHLLADARNEKVVARLRQRKQREEKPLAVMFPAISTVKLHCEVSALEEQLLLSPEAPIVLLKKIQNPKPKISPNVAPGNPNLGALLPSNPLQHLLLLDLDFPVVATSGNVSDEPICTDEHEALTRLHGIADFFLVHDRPIVRHLDDSIVRVMAGRPMILRRARGYAPLPISVKIHGSEFEVQNSNKLEASQLGTLNPEPKTILATGAHLKNSVALAVGKNVFLSQHLGDLETEAASQAFEQAAADLPKLYAVTPEIIAADLHPDYLSTRFAEGSGKKLVRVQHHVAHVLSCLAENETALPALGVAWDGTGHGTDGTVWGGEFFRVTENSVERLAHFRPFRLPGGDKAVKEPRRVALGLLYELYGEAVFEMEHLPPLQATPPVEMITLRGMLQRQFNSPLTSSVGRLFDAVASLINLRHQTRFEGQTAMELEFAIGDVQIDEAYAIRIAPQAGRNELLLDWSPLVAGILHDQHDGLPAGIISAKFHNALAETIVALARRSGEKRVALSGGCFQNRYLLERAVSRLRAENFQPGWHQRVPPNDGGIALGQVAAAFRESKSPTVNPKS